MDIKIVQLILQEKKIHIEIYTWIHLLCCYMVVRALNQVVIFVREPSVLSNTHFVYFQKRPGTDIGHPKPVGPTHNARWTVVQSRQVTVTA